MEDEDGDCSHDECLLLLYLKVTSVMLSRKSLRGLIGFRSLA